VLHFLGLARQCLSSQQVNAERDERWNVERAVVAIERCKLEWAAITWCKMLVLQNYVYSSSVIQLVMSCHVLS
jgi:hypothetical protein